MDAGAVVLDIASVLPGGILGTDRLHVRTYDETCSRCRQPIPEDAVPLLLWVGDGEDSAPPDARRWWWTRKSQTASAPGTPAPRDFRRARPGQGYFTLAARR